MVRRIIVSGGFCWICGELNPMFFEYHHLLGKKWKRGKANLSMGEDFIALCANDHRKYKATIQDVHLRLILKAIENGAMWNEK